jgi:hypothetical protein
MELVQNVLFKRQSSPSGIVPMKPIVRDLRRPVDASWLKSGRRIGSFLLVVQTIAVKRPGGDAFDYGVKIPAAESLHGNRALWRFAEADVNAVRPRGPKQKTACILTEKHGTKFFFMRRTHGFCIPQVARRLVTFSVYTGVRAIPRTRNSLRGSLIFSDREQDNSYRRDL